jgi:hypothetical protein
MEHALPPPARAFQLITAYWNSQIVGTLARLGVPDALAGGPAPAAEVASRVGASPDALHRVLRAATVLGLVEDRGGAYALTPVGETLRSNVPGSMRDYAIAETDAGHWLSWGHLDDAVRRGERSSRGALGMEIWEWYAQHPKDAGFFAGAMGNLAAGLAADLAAAFEVGSKKVVDVGGAHGTLVAALVKSAPASRGVLLDLPHVVEGAAAAFAAQGLAGRIETVAGDFFVSVPEGDLLVLKQVLHDWNDDECRAILGRCAAATRPGARLAIVEMVIPDDGSPGPAQLMDVNMLVMLTGRERTRGQYAQLLATAGFRLERELPARGGFSILDAVRT